MLPFVVSASWKSSECALNLKTCNVDTEEPYCVSSSDNVDYAWSCIFPLLTNNLSSLNSKPLWQFSTSDVIEQYCKALLWNKKDGRIYYSQPSFHSDTRDRNQTFDSHQSIFVYTLCGSFDNEWEKPFLHDTNYLPKLLQWDVVRLLKLQQKSRWRNKCSLSRDMSLDNCDMSLYATEIFTAIMSDLFKIKYAQSLHVDSVENFTQKEERISDFLSWYFNMTDQYKQLEIQFPQTIEIIDSNQQKFRDDLKSLKVINNLELVDLVKKSKCPQAWNMTWINFVACALHGSQWEWLSLTPSFVTLFNNELLSYRIFVAYYQQWIEAKITQMQIDKKSEKEIRIYQAKYTNLQTYMNMQIQAARKSLRDFEDFSMTYPLHIWILLYQETVQKFRNNNLSPIVTIFYSLSEKLQNVQIPN